jgi:hypothetical protein
VISPESNSEGTSAPPKKGIHIHTENDASAFQELKCECQLEFCDIHILNKKILSLVHSGKSSGKRY